MNDCTNAEMRDRLPDLLHADLAALADVQAHVKDCVDCQDELELLRSVRASIERQTPRVDVAYIVGALPKAPAPRGVTPIASRRRTFTDWRVAAAVTLLIAGGSSVALLRSPAATAPASQTAQVTPVPVKNDSAITTAAQTSPAIPTTEHTVASAEPSSAPTANEQNAVEIGNNRLGDLSEEQLQSLLGEIDKLKPVPVAEPEPASLKVNAKVSSEIL